MEHQSREDIVRVARLYEGNPSTRTMSKQDRLRRWVQLLDARPDRLLQTLYETEYRPRRVRDAMRCKNSAIALAFADPVLRAEGLTGDTYGEARRFFGLSDRGLHMALCYCHGGTVVRAGTAARRLEACLPRSDGPGTIGRLVRALAGRA